MIIKNKNTLKKLAALTGLKFDKKYAYCTSEAYPGDKELKLNYFGYALQYIDGCSHPFCITINATDWRQQRALQAVQSGALIL